MIAGQCRVNPHSPSDEDYSSHNRVIDKSAHITATLRVHSTAYMSYISVSSCAFTHHAGLATNVKRPRQLHVVRRAGAAFLVHHLEACVCWELLVVTAEVLVVS